MNKNEQQLQEKLTGTQIQHIKGRLEQEFNIRFPDNYNIASFTINSLAYTIQLLQRKQKEIKN